MVLAEHANYTIVECSVSHVRRDRFTVRADRLREEMLEVGLVQNLVILPVEVVARGVDVAIPRVGEATLGVPRQDPRYPLAQLNPRRIPKPPQSYGV